MDPGFLKGGGGSILGLQAKQGGLRGGSNFGPNDKKPTTWDKKGGPDPLTPPPDPPMISHDKIHEINT